MVCDAGVRIRLAQRPWVGSASWCGVRHPNGARLACATGGFPRSIDGVDVPWRRSPGSRRALGILALWFAHRGHGRRCGGDRHRRRDQLVGAAGLLAIWHDADTMAAIRASGGLSEVFELPIMMILPGAVLGTIGGVVGATIKRLHSAQYPPFA